MKKALRLADYQYETLTLGAHGPDEVERLIATLGPLPVAVRQTIRAIITEETEFWKSREIVMQRRANYLADLIDAIQRLCAEEVQRKAGGAWR